MDFHSCHEEAPRLCSMQSGPAKDGGRARQRRSSEAQEVVSPERMGSGRAIAPPASPFALAALQAHCGADALTVRALEAAILQSERSPAAALRGARRLGTIREGEVAVEPVSALDALALGDLPSPATPSSMQALSQVGSVAGALPPAGAQPKSECCSACTTFQLQLAEVLVVLCLPVWQHRTKQMSEP